jgi:hypothetical protein
MNYLIEFDSGKYFELFEAHFASSNPAERKVFIKLSRRKPVLPRKYYLLVSHLRKNHEE